MGAIASKVADMNASDFIALAALIISFMALLVSLSTKFSDFANAPWERLLGFVSGLLYTFGGLCLLYLWGFRPDPLALIMERWINDDPLTPPLPLWTLKAIAIGLLVLGPVVMAMALVEERRKGGQK